MISTGDRLDLGFAVRVVRAGGPVEEVAFSELLVQPAVVSIYMKNNTPSCDRQVGALVAAAPELARAGYRVMALSRNTAGAQARYAAARKIPFDLVSDPEDRFARAADALVEKQMYGRKFVGPARAAFILDRAGAVLAIVPKVDPARHAEQLLAAVRTLR